MSRDIQFKVGDHFSFMSFGASTMIGSALAGVLKDEEWTQFTPDIKRRVKAELYEELKTVEERIEDWNKVLVGLTSVEDRADVVSTLRDCEEDKKSINRAIDIIEFLGDALYAWDEVEDDSEIIWVRVV